MVQITNLEPEVFEGINVAADWIQDLKSSNSRKHKEKVIERALIASRLGSSSAQCFLYNCYLAYNPFYVYRVKQIPETEGLENKENPWIEFWGLLEDLRTLQHSGKRATTAIENMSVRFDSDEWNLVARPVLGKDLRSGISTKTLNAVLKNTEWQIPVFECQLAQDSENNARHLSGRKWIEPKLDGVRALAVVTHSSVTMYSCSGKVLHNFEDLEKTISDNKEIFSSESKFGNRFVVDGEVVSENFQELMTQLHRKSNTNFKDAMYYIFDIIPLSHFVAGESSIQQFYRHEIIQDIVEKIQSRTANIKGLQGIEVDLSTSEGHNIMHRYAKSSVDDGFEGIVIKDLNAPYTAGRSNAWLKWKPSITVDLRIVSVEEGTGRNAGRMGALICQGQDAGREIKTNVGSGFSDSQRDDIWKNKAKILGRIVEIKCDSVTHNQSGTYSLRFPRFLRFRGFSPDEKF